MWGINMSGIRIAGGFTYGIHAKNIGQGWNHDMRIEAVIEACETAVLMQNCHTARLAVTVQPCPAQNKVAYARNGIRLEGSKFTDLTGCRVWDWYNVNDDDGTQKNALWKDSAENSHIALFGNCQGTILDDFLYYELNKDPRDVIYSDSKENLDTMTILQEPITRWFKPKDGDPYFYNGNANYKLVT
jgi:hypothetical protein